MPALRTRQSVLSYAESGRRSAYWSEGEALGSVPRNVVRNAKCDVLVVQTSALDEDRVLGVQSAEVAPDVAAPGTRTNPGG